MRVVVQSTRPSRADARRAAPLAVVSDELSDHHPERTRTLPDLEAVFKLSTFMADSQVPDPPGS